MEPTDERPDDPGILATDIEFVGTAMEPAAGWPEDVTEGRHIDFGDRAAMKPSLVSRMTCRLERQAGLVVVAAMGPTGGRSGGSSGTA